MISLRARVVPIVPAACAVALGCTERDRPPAPEAAVEPALEAPLEILECRFDPVTSSTGTRESGFEMCYTPARRVGLGGHGGATGPEPDTIPAVEASPCPPEMILVEGKYCPDVRHECKRYIDDGGGRGGFLGRHRCAEFSKNPKCKEPREDRRFCIDRDEHTPSGDELPLVNQSWTMARDLCRDLGKRLCFGSEWEFACEGEAMLPYPYGFDRDAARCNHDRKDLSKRGKLVDYRVSSEARPECTSPFGVRNMVGNVDEWTVRDGFVRPWRSSLRGGWWLAGRNNCRAATTGHDEFYFGLQTGVRCCKNPDI